MGNVFIVAPAFAGALLFYFSVPGQRWLHRPWPARPARVAAAVCVAFSLACAGAALHPATSLAVVVTTLMASLTALPFVGVLIERSRAQRAAS
ncbi:hypothetical protein LMG24238_01275 [Paraburkholderia sediminicola]|uniref:Uncharacterized protein n=1 Tax=Paraburkholderia sediminicola TaxID=458836 RepID=A0A6J5A4J4_9BURK|nr:hypothetical protein LMG24238_01275 [Paraburkholderia sediminicola]